MILKVHFSVHYQIYLHSILNPISSHFKSPASQYVSIVDGDLRFRHTLYTYVWLSFSVT